MALLLVLGCSNGLAELEKKNSYFESVINIGQGFQEIFGIFGDAMGKALEFNAVKSGDNRSEVGAHFDKIKEGLENTNEKLKKLSGQISEAKNANSSTIETVRGAIKDANGVFDKLIGELNKLAKVTKEAGKIGDNNANAVGADKTDVDVVISGVKEIMETAKNSGVNVIASVSDVQVNNANGLKVVVHNTQAGAGDAAKLADEISKADPLAMINKIKDAKTSEPFNGSGDNGAGGLALGNNAQNNTGTAKSNADLAVAVALKAMTKNGKFSAKANAVNKVLGILEEIIRRTVAKSLEKVREAVKGINYADTNGEATEAKK